MFELHKQRKAKKNQTFPVPLFTANLTTGIKPLKAQLLSVIFHRMSRHLSTAADFLIHHISCFSSDDTDTDTDTDSMTASAKPPPAPVVVTASGGLIIGKTHGVTSWHPRAVDAFYGLPYARVPARFQPAVPVSPSSFTRFDASKAGKGKQPMYTPSASKVAEKTLTLNIFRPSPAAGEVSEAEGGKKKGLPVVVYIHGGGFNFGEPLERDHVAFVSWAAETAGRDVMVVSICYRLGVLGFLAGGGDDGTSLNLGLKDQRLALAWVQEHIAAFGGDGDDIRPLGISAGAHSIGHHILDPGGARDQQQPPLFRKAILESGAATARAVLAATHPRVQAQMASLQTHAQVSHSSGLATLDIASLLRANLAVWGENDAAVTWPFQPVVEDTSSSSEALIPDTPLRLWEQFAETFSSEENLAVITGFCTHEGTLFVPGRASTNADFRAFFAQLIPGFSAADLDLLEALYPDPVTDPSSPYRNTEEATRCGKGAQFTRLHEAYAHYAYICPVLYTAHMLSTMGRAAKKRVKVYVYEFAARAGALNASEHSSQAGVVAHDMVHLHGRPGLARVATAMHGRWTAFAASPDGSLPEETWPEFDTPFGKDGEGRMLVFGAGNEERVPGGSGREGVAVGERRVTEREKRQCGFWWERMALSEGRGERRKESSL